MDRQRAGGGLPIVSLELIGDHPRTRTLCFFSGRPTANQTLDAYEQRSQSVSVQPGYFLAIQKVFSTWVQFSFLSMQISRAR